MVSVKRRGVSPMRSMLKRIISAMLVTVMVLSMTTVVFADTFTDMPNDWRKGAIENAVKNGLISGKGNGLVAPDDNITRAEMASIIVRALGATKEADISKYVDVKKGSWYYNEFSKAVYMGAFTGIDENHMNPTGNITFQECFVVLSKVFGLCYRTTSEKAKELILAYSDGTTVASWASLYYGSILENGYWTGGPDKKLRGTDYINRGEFAVVMDNLVKMYIDEPGAVSELPEGNILVRCNDVVLDGIETKYDVIIGDGVEPEKVSVKDVKIDGRLVIRGCASEENKGKTSAVIGLTPTGSIYDIQLIVPYLVVSVNKLNFARGHVVLHSTIKR